MSRDGEFENRSVVVDSGVLPYPQVPGLPASNGGQIWRKCNASASASGPLTFDSSTTEKLKERYHIWASPVASKCRSVASRSELSLRNRSSGGRAAD
ncbi:acetyl-CoA synthetase [Anopheles sinensis]|uniref:Acetyl-CoA synthetase n=1 Tax=Anopheles sinensis TaxID=74873 RepID=A0A084VQG6_ANOSI|nr:acetyl-CoA synthetase [Anopheles sinensis]